MEKIQGFLKLGSNSAWSLAIRARTLKVLPHGETNTVLNDQKMKSSMQIELVPAIGR